MRRIHWLVLGAAAALFVNAGIAAAAPPNLKPAEKLCAAQGGHTFVGGDDFYVCVRSDRDWSDRELRVASRLCESAYKGSFDDFGGGNTYRCDFIPSS